LIKEWKILNNRLVLVGGNGFLGGKIRQYLSSLFSIQNLPSGEWDITPNLEKGSTVLMLRAMSSPTFVQKNPVDSNQINVLRTSKLINETLQSGARLIFTSSDVVYGHDEKNVFTEKNIKNPFGLYASQKAEIEERFSLDPNFFSLRLSLVVGAGCKLERILEDEEKPEIPKGVVRNPVHFNYVIEIIRELLFCQHWDRDLPNRLLNVGGRESIDIFDFAKHVAAQKNMNSPFSTFRSELDIVSRPAVTKIDSTMAENFMNSILSAESKGGS